MQSDSRQKRHGLCNHISCRQLFFLRHVTSRADLSEGDVPAIRVLLVEDEFLIRLILVEVLSDAGFQVTEADDGEEAITIMEREKSYDLLITDIQMPGSTDGIAVARHARERWPQIPILFATARVDSIGAFGKLGENDVVLQKPYGPQELLAVARRLLKVE